MMNKDRQFNIAKLIDLITLEDTYYSKDSLYDQAGWYVFIKRGRANYQVFLGGDEYDYPTVKILRIYEKEYAEKNKRWYVTLQVDSSKTIEVYVGE